MNKNSVLDKARYKLVEALCILDDTIKFGYTKEDTIKIETKLVEAINLINSNNPN